MANEIMVLKHERGGTDDKYVYTTLFFLHPVTSPLAGLAMTPWADVPDEYKSISGLSAAQTVLDDGTRMFKVQRFRNESGGRHLPSSPSSLCPQQVAMVRPDRL